MGNDQMAAFRGTSMAGLRPKKETPMPHARKTKTGHRNLEWFFAWKMMMFGIWILGPWSTMSTGAFDGVLALAAEQTWGAGYLFLGAAHATALAINGRAWWTPLIRLACVISGAIFYGLLMLGFAEVYWGTTAVNSYGMDCAGLLVCAYIAARDAAYSWVVHHANR